MGTTDSTDIGLNWLSATDLVAGYAAKRFSPGGSVRLPANWCGVVGFKPSFGRIPVDPPYAGRHIGPLTRTVADAALATSVLSGPDERDHTALPPVGLRWNELDGALTGVRIGLWLDPGAGTPVRSEVAANVTAAARTFEAAGAIVEPVAPILAFPAELAFPTADPDLGHQHIAFTVPFNMSGHPAISVNGGYPPFEILRRATWTMKT